jgi:hypothetical protein
MSVLGVNLKQLYQRWGLWLVYVMLVVFTWISIMFALDKPAAGEGGFIGLVAMSFIVGLVASVVQMEIMTKPFAFCLPGHRRVARTFIFLIGVVSNLACCFLFLLYPDLPAGYVLVVLCSAFFAGLVFYFIGVWATFGTGQPLAFVGYIVFAIVFGRLAHLHVFLEDAIVTMPLLVVTLAIAVTLMMWLYLGSENLTRKNSLRPWIGFAPFDPQKLRRFSRTRPDASPWERLRDHPRPWVEALFLGHMGRHGPYSIARFVWGSLYASFAVVFSRWKNVLLITLFLAVLLGYMGGRLWVVAFFVPMMMLLQMHLALHSTLLIAGGREQRLISTLATAVVGLVLIALVMILAVLTSIPLAAVIPDLTVRGMTLHYQQVGSWAFWVLVFVPLLYVFNFVFFKRPLAMAAYTGLVYVVMVVSFGGPLRLSVSPVNAVALAVVLWIVCIVTAHRIATRHDLVKR